MWSKKGTCTNLEEYIRENHGISYREFVTEQRFYNVKNMDMVAKKLLEVSGSKKHVTIVGDYDCDGITSVLEMAYICYYLNIDFSLVIPKRFSDGYGLSEKIIDNMDNDTVLITIDNGIAAIAAIEKAKSKNIFVIVMDHHIASVNESGEKVLPNADIIIDPEAIDDSADFSHYCGAGLAFKLAELLIPQNHPYYSYILALAAIGTTGDVVPLVGDNRQIVKGGLSCINCGFVTQGLKALMQAVGLKEDIKAESIAYYLSPSINAPGRLLDNGGEIVASTLFTENQQIAENKAKEVVELNTKRKEMVASIMENIDIKALEDSVNGFCYYNPDIPEGIAGIIAGKLAEETQKSVFVFTKSEDGLAKGSGRGNESSIHLKDFLDTNKELLHKFGGHKVAAGVSLPIDNIAELNKKLMEATKNCSTEKKSFYDFEITASQVIEYDSLMMPLEPFGEGNPKPIIKLTATLGNKYGNTFKVIGKEKNHIKFFFDGFDAIAFFQAEKYQNQSEITMIGTLEENIFNGRRTVQFNVKEFC